MVRYGFILSLMFAVAVFAQGASAQEQDPGSEFANPGITPDSPWYFFDDLSERARLVFAFNDEVKTRLELSFADERVAEIRVMVEEENEGAAEKARTRYEILLKQVESRTLSPEVIARIAEATGKHQAVLERVLVNAPESARPALEGVIERAKERHEARFEEVLELDEEEAGRVAGAVLEMRILALKEAVDAGLLTQEQAAELAQKLESQEIFFSSKERIKLEFRNEFAARLSDAYDDILELEDEDEDDEADDDVARVASRLRIKFEARLEQLVASDPALAASAVANASERIRLRIEQRIESEGNIEGLMNATDRLELVRQKIEIRIEQKIEDDENETEIEIEVEDEDEDEDDGDDLSNALKDLESAAENRIKALEQVKQVSDSEKTRIEIEASIKEEEKKREELKQSIEDREEQQKEEEENKEEDDDNSSDDDNDGDDSGGNSGSDGGGDDD